MEDAFTASVVFGLFCFMIILKLTLVKLFVPETKGTSLEEVESRFVS